MKRSIVAVGVLGAAAAAQAQYSTGFEPPLYAGAPAGVSVNGQDGWNQSPSGGIPHNVHTYAGNTLGVAANPNGGEQFLGGRGLGGTSFARSQHDVNWGASNLWVISYDLCTNYDGTVPATLNLASASNQRNDLGAQRAFIALKNFVDVNNPITGGWKSEFNVFDAAGAALNNQIAFTGMTTNHWYRESITLDFSTNQITLVTMTDLTTNVTSNFVPPGWYLTGGTNPLNPLPDAFRFFTGGSAEGNIMGWDNLDIAVPAPASLGLLGLAGLAAARRRR